MHVARIVHGLAKAGMCLKPAAGRQVHRMRRNIIDRDAAVVLRRRALLARLSGTNAGRENRRIRQFRAQLLDFPIR